MTLIISGFAYVFFMGNKLNIFDIILGRDVCFLRRSLKVVAMLPKI